MLDQIEQFFSFFAVELIEHGHKLAFVVLDAVAAGVEQIRHIAFENFRQLKQARHRQGNMPALEPGYRIIAQFQLFCQFGLRDACCFAVFGNHRPELVRFILIFHNTRLALIKGGYYQTFKPQ